MFRRTLAVVSLLSLGALVVPDVADARVPRPSASDVVDHGVEQQGLQRQPSVARNCGIDHALHQRRFPPA